MFAPPGWWSMGFRSNLTPCISITWKWKTAIFFISVALFKLECWNNDRMSWHKAKMKIVIFRWRTRFESLRGANSGADIGIKLSERAIAALKGFSCSIVQKTHTTIVKVAPMLRLFFKSFYIFSRKKQFFESFHQALVKKLRSDIRSRVKNFKWLM